MDARNLPHLPRTDDELGFAPYNPVLNEAACPPTGSVSPCNKYLTANRVLANAKVCNPLELPIVVTKLPSLVNYKPLARTASYFNALP